MIAANKFLQPKTLQSGPLGADVVGSSPGKTQHPVLILDKVVKL